MPHLGQWGGFNKKLGTCWMVERGMICLGFEDVENVRS